MSENPEFAEACSQAGIRFIGPKPEVMRQLGNKVMARNVAMVACVPVVPATSALPERIEDCQLLAAEVGYPLMLKASWGGGGRGMRVVENENELEDAIIVARREAKSAFGNDEVYLEKLIRHARHVEVQILGIPMAISYICLKGIVRYNDVTRRWSSVRQHLIYLKYNVVKSVTLL